MVWLEFRLRSATSFVHLLLGSKLVIGFVIFSFFGFVAIGLGKTLPNIVLLIPYNYVT